MIKTKENLFIEDKKYKKDNNNYREVLNPKEEIQIIKNKGEEKLNIKSSKFNVKEDKTKNKEYEKFNDSIKTFNNLNKSFSINFNQINSKENLSDNCISSFYYFTTKHLKEEFVHENSYSDFNNTHNYIPKFNLELNQNNRYNTSIRYNNDISEKK